MKLHVRTLVLVAYCIFACGSSIAEEFKSVPMSTAYLPPGASPPPDSVIPLRFTMPSVYERRDVPAAGIVVWGKAEDIDKAMTSNKMSQSSSGFFTLQPSTRVGFDTQTKRFTHEETALAEAKQMPGLVNPKFERVDANGFPIAAFTAEIGERHLYLLYVATGTGAILINYHHADPFTARDAEVWSQFIKGLGSR